MEVKDWVSNSVVLLSTLVMGLFSYLVWKASKVTADVAQATYQLAISINNKENDKVRAEKISYTLLVLHKINRIRELLDENRFFEFKNEMRTEQPIDHTDVSLYFDPKVQMELMGIWTKVISVSGHLYVEEYENGEWGIQIRGNADFNEKKEQLINEIQDFIDSHLGIGELSVA